MGNEDSRISDDRLVSLELAIESFQSEETPLQGLSTEDITDRAKDFYKYLTQNNGI